MIPIAILASGRGSNFDAIVRAIDEGRLGARIVAVVSDRVGAQVLGKADAARIPAHCVSLSPANRRSSNEAMVDERRREHEARILETIRPYGARFLVLAGYMRLLSPVLLEAFRSERGYYRVTNIHPSLLPAFPGLDGYAQAWGHGAKVSGCTAHLVDQHLDHGPICAQSSFDIADCRSLAEVESRGLQAEHRLYPETLSWVLPEKFSLETREGRACVRKN